MTVIFQQLIKLLPIPIIGLTVVFVMLSITWKRRHFFSAILSVLGLISAIASLWFIGKIENINIMSLMRVDGYSVLYSALVMLAGLITCILAYSWLENFVGNKEEFYVLVLVATLGGVVLVDANHLTLLSLGIELISLPLFGLVSYNLHQTSSLEAGIKYMILSAISSSCLLFGIALLYAQSGNLSFEALNAYLSRDILHKPLLLSGLGLMIVALSFKLSLVPFHLWTPDIYQGSPPPSSILLTTAGKIPVFVAMMRLTLASQEEIRDTIHIVLGIIAFFSIIFGNLMALNQANIKRLLGYSSISHFGYLLVILVSSENKQIVMEFAGIYLIIYLFSNLGIFGAINLISSLNCNKNLDLLFYYRGLFWHYPLLSMVMTIMMMSLAGIPATLGFIGKFYVLLSSIKMNTCLLIAAIIIGSSISFYYYLNIIINMYLKSPKQLKFNKPKNWQYKAGEIVMLVLALFVVILGIYPQPLISNIAKYTLFTA